MGSARAVSYTHLNRDQALAVRQSISLGLLLCSSAPDYFIRIRPGIRTVIDKDPVDTVHISSIRQFIQSRRLTFRIHDFHNILAWVSVSYTHLDVYKRQSAK